MHNVAIHRLGPEDVAAVARLEAESHYAHDPDIGVSCVSNHAWTEADIEELFSEAHAKAWVIEEGEGNIVGWFIYEVAREYYLLRRLLIDPLYRLSGIGSHVLWKMHDKIMASPTRKTLIASVRLSDVETCKWLAKMGFESRLVSQGWSDGQDAVEFRYSTAASLRDDV